MVMVIVMVMDKETYKKQQAFAGEKKPSMQRRCVGHDYTQRQMYMITMAMEGRRVLRGVQPRRFAHSCPLGAPQRTDAHHAQSMSDA